MCHMCDLMFRCNAERGSQDTVRVVKKATGFSAQHLGRRNDNKN